MWGEIGGNVVGRDAGPARRYLSDRRRRRGTSKAALANQCAEFLESGVVELVDDIAERTLVC